MYRWGIIATFDIETGYITLGTEGAGNRIQLPFTLEVYKTNPDYGDNIFVMSADKKTISIHEDLSDMILLVGSESGEFATITDFTATLKE